MPEAPTPQPGRTPAQTATADYVAALKGIRRSKSLFWVLVFAALLADVVAFSLVEWLRWFDPEPKVAISIGTAADWADALDRTLAWARPVSVFAATGLSLSLFAYMIVALVGRLGGARASCRAFFGSVWIWVLLVPWNALPIDLDGGRHFNEASLGPIVEFGRPESITGSEVGTDIYSPDSLMGRHREMVRIRPDKDSGKNAYGETPTEREQLLREVGYFGRFVAYPAILLLMMLVVQFRFARAYVESVRMHDTP